MADTTSPKTADTHDERLGEAPEESSPEVSNPGDELEYMLTHQDIVECERGLMMVNSAIYGFPTPFDDFNKELLRDTSRKVADNIDTRLRLLGAVDSDNTDAGDSRVAAFFIHTAVRFTRLSRHRKLQVGFLGHTLMAMVGCYVVRAQTINSLYPSDVYFAAVAALTLLQRLDTLEKLERQARADQAAAETPSNRRKDATAEANAPQELISETSDLQAVRKLCLTFLHACADVLPACENEIIRTKENGLSAEFLQKEDFIPKIREFLARGPSQDVLTSVDMAWSQAYSGGASVFVSFVLAPLTLLCGLGGVALLWSPILFPELVALNTYLRVSPPFEWVRYLLSGLLVAVMFVVMYFILAQTGGRAFPRKFACVHSYLSSDGDVRKLFSTDVGAMPLDIEAIDQVMDELTAREGAATQPESAAADATAEATENAGDAAAAEQDAAGYWAEAMGVSEQEAQTMIDAFGISDSLVAQARQSSEPGAQLPMPDDLLPTLQDLYFRLEELGEVDILRQVYDRIIFLKHLLQQGTAGEGVNAEDTAEDETASSESPTGK